MQAYVHKDGKNLGPYTVRELRSRVEDGILLPDDLACHDGQNWVKISQVPGFESSIPPPPPPPPSSVPPPIEGASDQPSATERAKSLAGNLFKKSKETVDKIAASDQMKQAKKKASETKEKITSSEKFRSLKDKFKLKPNEEK